MNGTMKPIPGCPGYFITREGDVYSTNNNKNKEPRIMSKQMGGDYITLFVSGERKNILIKTLVDKVWGRMIQAEEEPKYVRQYNPKYALVDSFGNFI